MVSEMEEEAPLEQNDKSDLRLRFCKQVALKCREIWEFLLLENKERISRDRIIKRKQR